MNSIKSIYWQQGLFLKPHHFQYLHAQQQEEIAALRTSIQPYYWGLSKVSVNKQELNDHNLVIDALEVVFRDGTLVRLPQNARISNRSFETRVDEADEEIQVYVGLKMFDKNKPNVIEVDSFDTLEDIDTRYISKSDSLAVSNLYHADETAEVQFLDYCLKLFFDDEIKNLNGYQLLPLAKIRREGDQMLLSSTYTTPLLDINADTHFFEIVKSIQKDLSFHLLQLHEYKLPSNIILQEANYLKYVMALQALSPFAPRLNHMIKTPGMHPWKFYELLLELVAVLSTFSDRVNIFGRLENGNLLLKEYDHTDLYACFDGARTLIKELLDVIIIGPEYILPFTKEASSFTLECPLSLFQARYRYFLLLKAPTHKEEMATAFSRYAKIAAASEIDTIVERSLPGLPFRPYDMPIQGLPEREDSVKYELLIDDPQWNAIQQMQNITIEFDDALEDVAIELVVVKS